MLWTASATSFREMNIVGCHLPRRTPAIPTTMFRTISRKKNSPVNRWISRTLSIPPSLRMNHCDASRCQNRWDKPVAKSTTVVTMMAQCSAIRKALNLRTLSSFPDPRRNLMRPVLSSVDGVPPDVQEDLQDQPRHHQGGEDPVDLVDQEDERELRQGRLVMEQPGVGEVRGRVLVALLAPPDEVRLDRVVGARRAGDIVRPVAVRAHGDRPGRLVELLP